MGLASVINRNLRQQCVYWGNPRNDGQGGFIFDSPVQIKCRWEDMAQIVVDSKGNEHTSRAVVYINEDLDENGMLHLGLLSDLTPAQMNDPMSYSDDYLIKRVEKEPVLNSPTEFLRKVFLTPSLSFGGF
jgi:hypothetical protein